MKTTRIRNFRNAPTIRKFQKGKFEIFEAAGITIGLATYEPGWKWSEHVGPEVGEKLCSVEHLGVVISGRAAVEMSDGKVYELKEGDLFEVPGQPHDSWVIGNQEYVSLHIMGAEDYADNKKQE